MNVNHTQVITLPVTQVLSHAWSQGGSEGLLVDVLKLASLMGGIQWGGDLEERQCGVVVSTGGAEIGFQAAEHTPTCLCMSTECR